MDPIKTFEEFKSTNADAKKLMAQFESSEKLEKLLEGLQPMFHQIDYNGMLFRKGQVTTDAVLQQILDYATGAAGFINKVFFIADHEYKVQRAKFKIEAKKKAEKITDAMAEAESMVAANLWSRAAGLLEGYEQTLRQQITTCQTKLRKYSHEEKPQRREETIVG